MKGPEMLDKLYAMCRLVENAPGEVEYSYGEATIPRFRKLPTICLESGIEAFGRPLEFLYGTESYDWFGFVLEGILVCQAFARNGGGPDAQTL